MITYAAGSPAAGSAAPDSHSGVQCAEEDPAAVYISLFITHAGARSPPVGSTRSAPQSSLHLENHPDSCVDIPYRF